MNFSIIGYLQKVMPGFKLTEIEHQLMAELQQMCPKNKIRLVQQTEIPNVFEVISDISVLYLLMKPEDLPKIGTGRNMRERYRFFMHHGKLLDYLTSQNLNQNKSAVAALIDVSVLPLEDAELEERGNGENILYVFSDPTNEECQRLDKVLAGLDDVSIYRFYLAGSGVSKAVIKQNLKLAEELCIYQLPTYFFENGQRYFGVVKPELITGMFENIARTKEELKNS